MAPSASQKKYINPPSSCDFCHNHFVDEVFYDAKTRMGPWGNLCSTCFAAYGVGLGTGKGQRYESRRKVSTRMADGSVKVKLQYVKTDG